MNLQSARPALTESHHQQRMIVLERPPVIAALRPQDLPVAIRAAERIDSASLSQRESSRWVGADALPFLTETSAGRAFLAAAPPRAIARGMPAEYCPAVASAAGPGGASAQAVAGQALERCLARLGTARGDCGCRVIALDNLLLVPREETVYATGTTARLRSAALGIDLLLVAEELPDGTVLLRDLRGTVARLERGPGDSVTLHFAETGRSFEGRSIPVGFRRGRIAERIYATDTAGNRLVALVGFAPAELAGSAAAWLTWPSEG